MAIKRIELKTAIKETIQAFSDNTDIMLLEQLNDTAWDRIADKLEGELRKIGIKVV